MSGRRDQYAVYRLRGSPDYLASRRGQPYPAWREQNRKVTSDLYRQVCISQLDPAFTLTDLRRQLESGLPAGIAGDPLAVSDVLAVTKGGITAAYYVDPDRLVVLTGFFHVASSPVLLSLETTDYQIEGRPGNWLAAEEAWIDGRMNNMPPKPIIHKRRTGRTRKNGRLPIKGRESVLKRLKQYQTELTMQRGQPSVGHEEPETVERKK